MAGMVAFMAISAGKIFRGASPSEFHGSFGQPQLEGPHLGRPGPAGPGIDPVIEGRGFATAVATLFFGLALQSRARRHRRSRHVACSGLGLSVQEVNRYWQDLQVQGLAPEELASTCALLCCVQRQLGVYAAVHEAEEGLCQIVGRAPPLPLALSWEVQMEAGGSYQVQSRGVSVRPLALGTLLGRLVFAHRSAQDDCRLMKAPESKSLRARVSFLHRFEDITKSRNDWVAGTHGLWFLGSDKECVYLPDSLQGVASGSPEMQAQKIWQSFLERRSPEEATAANLNEGCQLYRFEILDGHHDFSKLPATKTREVGRDNSLEMLVAQAKAAKELDVQPRFAALASASQVRAVVVPTDGAYGNAQLTFFDGFKPDTELKQVRRIFVIARSWDSFIDGIALPDQRCAWYGKMPLNLVILDKLRNTGQFAELSMERDISEHAIEALLPILQSCVASSGRELTIVPLLLGNMDKRRCDVYAKLLAPFLSDPKNFFVVAADLDQLASVLPAEDSENSESPALEADLLGLDTGVTANVMELFALTMSQTPKSERPTLARIW